MKRILFIFLMLPFLTKAQTYITDTIYNPILFNAKLGTPISGNFSSGTFTWPTFNQNTTGSAATLTTARNIWGQSFNGSAAVDGAFTQTLSANTTGITSTGYSLTGSNASSLIDLAGTWNTSGNPTAIKLNVTNTASGASANLMDLQVGGVSQFKIEKNGNANIGNNLFVTSNLRMGSTNAMYWNGKGGFTSPVNGISSVVSSSFTDFTGTLRTGGFQGNYVAKTSAYTATLSDYTIDCTSGTFTVTLPTAVGITGQIYFITNSGAGTITIATTSSQTFTNVSGTPTTLTLATPGSVQVHSTGANWLQLK